MSDGLGGRGCCTKCTGHQNYFIVCALISPLQWEMSMGAGWLPVACFTPTEHTADRMGNKQISSLPTPRLYFPSSKVSLEMLWCFLRQLGINLWGISAVQAFSQGNVPFAFCAGCSSSVGYHSPHPAQLAPKFLQLWPRADLVLGVLGVGAPGNPMLVVPWFPKERMKKSGWVKNSTNFAHS